MSEDTEKNDWSERIDKALSGTSVEQVREMIDRLRTDLAHVATQDDVASLASREDVASLASREDVASLASREDLVRGLESVAAARRADEAPVIDPEAIDTAITAQAERILGGFAQRVGQLQTAITRSQESLLERIEQLDTRVAAERPPAIDLDALSDRLGEMIGENASTLTALSSAVEQLARKVDDLASAPPAPSDGDAETGRALEGIREELRSLDVAVRTEIDAAFRARDEAETKQVDALGLRVTNLSMSVTQALDAVRAQVTGMQERAERLEAEQAAILEAIRSAVAGIGSTVAENVAGGTTDLARAVTDRVTAIESAVGERLAALDEPLRAAGQAREDLARVAEVADRLDAIGQVGERLALLDQVLERVRALEGVDERMAVAVKGAVEPLSSMRDELRELADHAIQLGALPQMEAQLHRVEEGLSTLGVITDRLDALPGLTERLDALGPVSGAIERMREDVGAIPSMREHLRALAERPADREQLDAIADRLSPLDTIADRLSQLDAIAERSTVLEGLDHRLAALTRLDDVAQMLAQVGARIDELPEVAATAVASRVDGAAGELWTIVERLPASVDERLQALRDRIEQRLEGLHVDLGDVDRLREVVDGMLTTAHANEQRLIETATQLDAVAGEMREEVGRALSRVTVRLDGVESAVARTILDVRAALEEGARGSADAIEGVGGRLGALTQRLDALDETTASVRAHLGSLPSPSEVSVAVTHEVADVMATFRTATEGRISAVERDLTGVATNVNEIWMRARAIAHALEGLNDVLDQQAVVLGEQVSAADARIERVLEGEQRTAQRIVELEERFITAARGIETERDRVFIEAFDAMLDRLARDERRLAKRLRGLVGRRKRGDVAEPVATIDRPGAAPTSGAAVPEQPTVERAPTQGRAPSKPARKKKPSATKRTSEARSSKKNIEGSSASRTADEAAISKKRATAKKATAKKTTRARSRATSKPRSAKPQSGTTRPNIATAPPPHVEDVSPEADSPVGQEGSN